jgi:hypothetical protein
MAITRTSKLLWLAAAFAALTALAPTSVAEAQRGGRTDIGTPFTGQRPFQLDVHAGFTWWGWGFASGARFGIPILHNGPIPSINNALYINFGLDAYYLRHGCRGDGWGAGCRASDYGFGLGIPVTVHWEFYFNDRWSAFVELGFQVFFHPSYWHHNEFYIHGGQWFVGAVGGTFHINEWLGLTLRVGTPYVAFGLTFEFG